MTLAIVSRQGLHNWVAPACLALALGLVYEVTLAPGLTWAHQGADGGDLIAAAASGGVAHPTGYPVYLLLARLFLKLPVGLPAWRVNLLSAASAIGAALCVAEIVRSAYAGRSRMGRVGGCLAGFVLGVSPLLWSQAVIAEVYSLHVCLLGLCWLTLPWGQTKPISGRRLALAGLVLGLALGNHVTALFMVPVAIWTIWQARPSLGAQASFVLTALTTVGVLYGLLAVWASGNPAINWGNAASWSGWLWVVTAEPYRGLAFGAGQVAWLRFREVLGLWVTQFGVAGVLIGLGAVILLDDQPRWLRLGLIWLFFICSVFTVGYNTADSYNYLTPAFLAFAVELGLGCARLLDVGLQSWPTWPPLILAGLLILVFWNAVPAMVSADASRDVTAEQFLAAVVKSAPSGAVIITAEDRDSFALWYLREALGTRRDLYIIVNRLWDFDWYQRQLVILYPDLSLPANTDPHWPMDLGQRNHRPICWTQPDQSQPLTCQPF